MKKLLLLLSIITGLATAAEAAFLVNFVRRTAGPTFGAGNTHYNIWNTGNRLDQPLPNPLTTAQGTFSWDVNSVSEWDAIDFGRGGGNFNYSHGGNQGGPNNNIIYPDGTQGTQLDQYSIRAWTKINIPEGDYTIGWGSDDGGFLQLEGVSWLGVANGNTDNLGTTGLTAGDVNNIGNDKLWHGTGRGHAWNLGSFTVPPGGLETSLFVSMWEGGGGDSFELAIKDSHDLSFGGVGEDWELLRDGIFGITTTNDFGLVPEPSTSFSIFIGLGVLSFMRRLQREMGARRFERGVK